MNGRTRLTRSLYLQVRDGLTIHLLGTRQDQDVRSGSLDVGGFLKSNGKVAGQGRERCRRGVNRRNTRYWLQNMGGFSEKKNRSAGEGQERGRGGAYTHVQLNDTCSNRRCLALTKDGTFPRVPKTKLAARNSRRRKGGKRAWGSGGAPEYTRDVQRSGTCSNWRYFATVMLYRRPSSVNSSTSSPSS